MRFFAAIALAISFVAITSGQVNAQQDGFTGQSHSLTFVSDTKLKDMDGNILDLCHLTEDRHLLGQGIWVASKGYVLAQNKCQAETFFTFTDAQLQQGLLDGNVPETIPALPEMNEEQIVDRMRGYTLMAIGGGVLVLIGISAFAMQRRRAAWRKYHEELLYVSSAE
ncbi:hypothetical protein BXY66_0564 [Shimia isoporae]|uniref:Uncharacterized protein n=1 Tax=Shimia isoporae TaxID=647720 RepID=A0A4R1NJS3_9RHOB|nr:hypothetical protein [Shimia isoporae]TCL08527.1 hypothetical protein BXY66_0564 [Shimia isoporae]